MADFIVVKAPSSYNDILGLPTLNCLKAVTSTYQFKIKFPSPMGVGEVQGEQVSAPKCYKQELEVGGGGDPCSRWAGH